MATVWQVATGDNGRDYSQLCIQHDVMCVGPGRYGPFDPAAYRKAIVDGQFTALKIGTVRRFCRKVRPGDIILLRKGHRVVSIGLAAEDGDGTDGYRFDPAFDDVYGWDLQHTRRVAWQCHLELKLQAMQKACPIFGGRTQIPTFTRVNERPILAKLEPLFPKCKARNLRPRPDAVPETLSLEEFGEALFAKGLANDAVEKVLAAIARQRRLLRWYREQGKQSDRPDEHEVVAHMVLPLLLALGWSEQLLAIEWHKVDLAAFEGTPTTKERCLLVCEAKRMGHGLQDIWDQAVGYVKNLGLSKCRKILLTQGARFYLYQHEGDRWPDEPTGYLNVERIRTNHLAPAHTSAVDTLMALTPAGVQR